MVTVIVKKNDSLDKSLRIFDLKCRKAKVFQQLRKKAHYVSPSEQRHRKKSRRKLTNQI